MDRYLAARLEDRLREFGLEVDAEPLRDWLPKQTRHCVVSRGKASQRVTAIYAPPPIRSAVLGAYRGEPTLVLSEWIPDRIGDELRSAGVQHLDAAGNAHIDFGDVLIDVRGRRRDRDLQRALEGSGDNRSRATSLFTPARAQIVFALLSWPTLLDAPVRTLAAAATVSVGQAQNALAELRQSGYVQTEPARLRDPQRLLELWLAAYPAGLARKAVLRELGGDPENVVVPDGATWYLSGEVAAGLRRPETLTVYVDEMPIADAIANRWVAAERPNITVRRRFWRAPEDDERTGLVSAPALLVYADLVASGDPRQREAADELRGSDARLREIDS